MSRRQPVASTSCSLPRRPQAYSHLRAVRPSAAVSSLCRRTFGSLRCFGLRDRTGVDEGGLRPRRKHHGPAAPREWLRRGPTRRADWCVARPTPQAPPPRPRRPSGRSTAQYTAPVWLEGRPSERSTPLPPHPRAPKRAIVRGPRVVQGREKAPRTKVVRPSLCHAFDSNG